MTDDTDNDVVQEMPARRSVDTIHAALREAILNGDLSQGAILSQIQLAKQFGVSRTPLREALRMLQAEGFIDSSPNRRVRVATISVPRLEQLYTMRIVLEAVAIRLTTPCMSAGDLERLEAHLDAMDRFTEIHDIEGYNHPHREFHRGLTAHAGPQITVVLGQLADNAARYRRLYTTQATSSWGQAAIEHRAILAACKRRDPAEAAVALARHLARTALTVLALLAPEHDPAAIRVALSMVLAGSDGGVADDLGWATAPTDGMQAAATA